MEQQELSARIDGARAIERGEAGGIGLPVPDLTDLWSGARSPDGDGGMLGLVLVYAAIIIVAVLTILWKHFT